MLRIRQATDDLTERLGRAPTVSELSAAIAPALRALPRRDREMLYMRFALDMTQSEIGQRLGCSQMQFSRLLRRELEGVGRAGHGTEPLGA